MSSTPSRPSRSTLLRDWLTYVGGWFLVLTQSGVPGLLSPPEQPSETLFWGGMGLICVQGGYGAASILAARFGGTTGSPSPAPAPELPPPPSGTA